MTKKNLIYLLFLISFNFYSQKNKAIQKLDTELQKCLDDTKNNMLNCTLEYYNKIDEQLNVIYKKVRTKLNKTEQEKLKKQQLSWLKKRDLYFKKVAAETSSDLEGDHSSQDYRMICSHENALFVIDRIIELEKTYLTD